MVRFWQLAVMAEHRPSRSVVEPIMLPRHETKLVATIGPASSSASVIAQMIEAGMNVAHLAFSYGVAPLHEPESAWVMGSLCEAMGARLQIAGRIPDPH